MDGSSDPRRPKVALVALGCRVSRADVDSLAAELGRSFDVARAGEAADFVVVNGCSITADADAAARRAIRRAGREHPRAAIVAAGCAAELRGEALAALPNVAAVVGARSQGEVARVLARLRGGGRGPDAVPRAAAEPIAWDAEPAAPVRHTRPFLKVQDGCDQRCSYCVVPLARGPSRSLPLGEAVRRFARLGERHAEVVLTGVHLGAYGRDLAPARSLADLVREAARRQLVGRLRLSSIEPNEFPVELLDDPAAASVLCEHFHLPVQSGSDRVLAAMRRPHRARDFRGVVLAIAARAPGACIGTDVMVGFPGETEDDHGETVALVESLPVAYLHVFPFSARPGTAAASMAGAVPAPVVRRRARELLAASERRWRAFLAAQAGEELDVVVERVGGGIARGTSGRYAGVRWRAGAERRGERVRVRVEADDGSECRGVRVAPYQPGRILAGWGAPSYRSRMQLHDGRVVPDLPLDPSKVERCRALADEITAKVLELVRRHTTVSIERTALRLLGFHDAGPRGVPLVNLAVDALHERRLLGRGAAYWLGYALRRGATDPVSVVARLHALPPHPEPLPPEEERAMTDELRRDARAAVGELLRRVEARDALKAELGVGPRPHKYLIVATGNIHDDVEQARAAAQAGADVIAVIRSTAQSLLDYVPHGATTEGYGGTYATQENFRIMRAALDDESRRLGRYLHLTNYSSGLCMPEIAFTAAWERLDMLLNDAMYGILFRDINMKRTLCDQHFSRRICALAGIVINTGEDNYITTADADEAAHTVIASQFVNQSFARRAGLPDRLIGLGHSFEIDPAREDTVAREIAQALLVRTLFPESPIKYMPPTKHKQGDIFFSHAYDTMADVVSWITGQEIQLLGMMTEAMHNPFLMDRYVALKTADYVYRAWLSMGAEIRLRPGGMIERRADETLGRALALLEEVARDGLMKAIGKGRFADVARTEDGGKGLSGVVERGPGYFNPFLEIMEAR